MRMSVSLFDTNKTAHDNLATAMHRLLFPIPPFLFVFALYRVLKFPVKRTYIQNEIVGFHVCGMRMRMAWMSNCRKSVTTLYTTQYTPYESSRR